MSNGLDPPANVQLISGLKIQELYTEKMLQ